MSKKEPKTYKDQPVLAVMGDFVHNIDKPDGGEYKYYPTDNFSIGTFPDPIGKVTNDDQQVGNKNGVLINITNGNENAEGEEVDINTKTYFQYWYSEKLDATFFRILEKKRSGAYVITLPWEKVMTSKNTYSKEEANKKFVQASFSSEALTDKPIGSPIKGGYGLNLFDYRYMSNDHQFGVDGKVFKTLGKRKFDRGTQSDAKQYNRIREKDEVFFQHRVLESSHFGEGDEDDQLHIQIDLMRERADEYNFPQSPLEIWTEHRHTFQDYGYFRFQLGGWNNPVEAKAEIRAWYGDFCPEILDQQFVFPRYNNIPLMAMETYKYSQSNLTKGERLEDVYQRKLLGDEVTKKVGLFNLKDAKQFALKTANHEDNYLVLVPIPDDCNELTQKLMSNNLCDLTAEEDLNEEQDKPFFMRNIGNYNFPVYDKNGNPVLNEYGDPINESKNCFQILLGRKHLAKWKQHLTNTQIMYEIRSPQTYKVPFGGLIFTTTSGDSIKTCMYGKVEMPEKDKTMIEFTDSPFGFPDQAIFVQNIVQVTQSINQ